MKTKRLQEWATKLRSINPEHFDISSWVQSMNPEELTLEAHTCGTAACAAGYLPLFFPEDWIHDNWGEPGYKDGGDDCVSERWSEEEGDYISCFPSNSVETYFDISPIAAESIIQGYRYLRLRNNEIAPSHVANRIEAIIDWDKAGKEQDLNTYLFEVGK